MINCFCFVFHMGNQPADLIENSDCPRIEYRQHNVTRCRSQGDTYQHNGQNIPRETQMAPVDGEEKIVMKTKIKLVIRPVDIILLLLVCMVK